MMRPSRCAGPETTHTGGACATSPPHPPAARSAQEEADITAFRFTLGNEDWDNAVPRVVGVLAGAALVANHVSAGNVSPAQETSEAIGAVLAALCLAMPSVEKVVRDADPGRGRKELSQSIEGSAQIFKIADDGAVTDSLRTDLAWACFSLLKSTNACTAVVVRGDGSAAACRGAVGEEALGGLTQGSGDGEVLAAVGRAAAEVARGAARGGEAAYLPDRLAVGAAGGGKWALVPRGCNAVLVVPMGPQGWLVLLSEQERAFSTKERAWADAVARKLQAQL